jgi:hypothetical protein
VRCATKVSWTRSKPASIPKATQNALQARLEQYAQKRWRQHCREVVVRFRAAFAYVDALPSKRQSMPGTPRERREQIQATPTRLFRLRYLGSDDAWEYAFFKYSDEKYELSLGASGSFEATPEEAFDCSARIYLMT